MFNINFLILLQLMSIKIYWRNMFSFISLDVFSSNLSNTSSIVFIYNCWNISCGRQIVGALNMMDNRLQPNTLPACFMWLEDLQVIRGGDNKGLLRRSL